jgi:hypothetical protein
LDERQATVLTAEKMIAMTNGSVQLPAAPLV